MATALPDGSSVGFEVRWRDVTRMLDPIEIWEICWLDPRLELFLMFLEPFPSSFCRRRAAAIRECCWHDGMYFVCSAALQMSGYITPA